jgi:hypothetical protein
LFALFPPRLIPDGDRYVEGSELIQRTCDTITLILPHARTTAHPITCVQDVVVTVERLGDNARECGSLAARAFTELGLSQISRVAGEHDHRGSSIPLIQPGCRTPGLAVPCWTRSVQYDHVGLQTGHRCLDGGEMHVEQSRNNQAFVYKGPFVSTLSEAG